MGSIPIARSILGNGLRYAVGAGRRKKFQLTPVGLRAPALFAAVITFAVGCRGSNSPTAAITPTPSSVIDVQFVSHLQAKLPEQDVFVATADNQVMSWRRESLSSCGRLRDQGGSACGSQLGQQ